MGFCEHHNEISGSIKYTVSLIGQKLLASQKWLSCIGISHLFKYFFKFLKPLSTGQKTALICPEDVESKSSKMLLNLYQTTRHHILEDSIPHTTTRFSQEFSALLFIKSFQNFTKYRYEICNLLGYYTAYGCNSLLMFQDNLSVPSSRSRNQRDYSNFLTLEDGSNRLSQNVGKELLPYAAQYPRRAKLSSTSWPMPEIRQGTDMMYGHDLPITYSFMHFVYRTHKLSMPYSLPISQLLNVLHFDWSH